MRLPDPATVLGELQAECEYSPDREGSVDALIAYKDALEDAYGAVLQKAAAWDRIDEMLRRNARGESHAGAADVAALGFALQEALR